MRKLSLSSLHHLRSCKPKQIKKSSGCVCFVFCNFPDAIPAHLVIFCPNLAAEWVEFCAQKILPKYGKFRFSPLEAQHKETSLKLLLEWNIGNIDKNGLLLMLLLTINTNENAWFNIILHAVFLFIETSSTLI